MRIRAKGLANLRISRAHFGWHLPQLVRNRREDHLHRFDQVQAVLHTQRLQGAVHILRVRAVLRQRRADLLGLFDKAADGIDLAVVPHQGERLGALEGGDSVGRVARVAQRHRRVVDAVGQVGVVAGQGLHRSADLVNHCVRRERGKMNGVICLQVRLEVQQALFQVGLFAVPGKLPEHWRVDACVLPEHVIAHAPGLRDQQVQPGLVEAPVQLVQQQRNVKGLGYKQVPDPKAGAGCQRAAQVGLAELARP